MKTLFFFLAVLVLAGASLATEEPRQLSPMMQEIQASMEAVRLEVAELKLRHEAAVDSDEAQEIMLEATRVKREGRIELMRIQLRHARLNGNDELVAELEEIVAKMTAPPRKGVPVPRNENHQ